MCTTVSVVEKKFTFSIFIVSTQKVGKDEAQANTRLYIHAFIPFLFYLFLFMSITDKTQVTKNQIHTNTIVFSDNVTTGCLWPYDFCTVLVGNVNRLFRFTRMRSIPEQSVVARAFRRHYHCLLVPIPSC